MQRLDLTLLGDFEVRLDRKPIAEAEWAQGRARDLVKVLALAPDHRLIRERVIEMLWPQLDAEAGAANLHKAAHHARRALRGNGDPDLYAGELLPSDRYAAWTQERVLRRVRPCIKKFANAWTAICEAKTGDACGQLLIGISTRRYPRPGASYFANEIGTSSRQGSPARRADGLDELED